MKTEIRILGLDDTPFDKFRKKDVQVIGTVFRGGLFLDGVVSTKVRVDGSNSTKKIIEMINKCKFKTQLRCILTDGIAFGGFNIFDAQKLSKETKIPVIIVIRRMPDFKRIKATLKKIGMEHKYKMIEEAGAVIKVGKIYIQPINISLEKAKEILKLTCTRSYLPEPIRVAHLIGQGLVFGESKGRA